MNYNRFKERNPCKQGPNKKTHLGIHKALRSAKAGDMFVKGDDGKLQPLHAGEQGIPPDLIPEPTCTWQRHSQ